MKRLILLFLLISSLYSKQFYSLDLGTKNYAIGSVKGGKVDLVLNGQSKRLTPTVGSYADEVYLYGENIQKAKRAIKLSNFLPWDTKPDLNITTDFLNHVSTFIVDKSPIAIIVPPTISEEQLAALKLASSVSNLNVQEIVPSPLMVALSYVMYHTQQFNSSIKPVQILDLGYSSSHHSVVNITYDNYNIDLTMINASTFPIVGKDLDNTLRERFGPIDTEKLKKALTNSNVYTEVSETENIIKVTANDYNQVIEPLFAHIDQLDNSVPLILSGGSSRIRGLKAYLMEKGFSLLNVNTEEAPTIGGALYAARSISRIKPSVYPVYSANNTLEDAAIKNFTISASNGRKLLKTYELMINTLENITAITDDVILQETLDRSLLTWCSDLQCMNSTVQSIENSIEDYIQRKKDELEATETVEPEIIEPEPAHEIKEDL